MTPLDLKIWHSERLYVQLFARRARPGFSYTPYTAIYRKLSRLRKDLSHKNR